MCPVIDWLDSFINFKSWLGYCLTESLILYAASFVAGVVLRWFTLEPAGILVFTAIFAVGDALFFVYCLYRQKLVADEINAYLQN